MTDDGQGRWTTDDRHGGRMTDDGRWTTDDRRRTKDDGRWTTDDGRRTTDDGRRTTDDGRRTTDDGRQVTDDRRTTYDGCRSTDDVRCRLRLQTTSVVLPLTANQLVSYTTPGDTEAHASTTDWSPQLTAQGSRQAVGAEARTCKLE